MKYLINQLEEVFIELSRLNELISANDKTEILPNSLLGGFGLIAKMSEENMDYDSIFALIKSNIER